MMKNFPSGDGDWTAGLLKCPHRSLYLFYRNLAQVLLIRKSSLISFSIATNQQQKQWKMHGEAIKNNENIPKEQPEKWQNHETTITGASLEWLSARHCETRSTFFSTRIVQVSLWEQWYLICSYCWYSLVIKINLPIRWSGVYGAGRSPSWVSHQWHWQDLHRHTQVSAISIISI